jgi:hypothetical protein
MELHAVQQGRILHQARPSRLNSRPNRAHCMTYRLVPVGSGGQAEVVPGGMSAELIWDHAIGDIAGGG